MSDSGYVALIVDRNASERKSLSSILRQGLHIDEVLHAQSANEAIKILKSTKTINWLFCDTSLPDQDSFTFLEEAKQMAACKDASLILLSSQTNKDILIKAAASGVSDFIKKPFTSSTLIVKLRRLIAGAKQRTSARHSLLGAYTSKMSIGDVNFEGKLLDLSLGGCRLVCAVPEKPCFTVFDTLSLEFDVNGKALTLNGETVRIERNQGAEEKSMIVAFQFVKLAQEQHDLLSQFIDTIQSPKKPESALKKSA